MQINDVIGRSTEFLKLKGIESARLNAELLISHALDMSRVDLYLRFDQPLNERDIQKCRELIVRNGAGEPVAYLVGHKEFFGYDFQVDNSVLIPRPETEELVEHALAWLESGDKNLRKIADLGCGSGCISQSILLEMKKRGVAIEMHAVDISEAALATAKSNAERHGLIDEIQFHLGDASNQNFKDFDLILANPPYIAVDDENVQPAVKKFEPGCALFAGESGFEAIRLWSQSCGKYLRSGGRLIFEIGKFQGPKAESILKSQGSWDDIKTIQDLSGATRFISAIRS